MLERGMWLIWRSRRALVPLIGGLALVVISPLRRCPTLLQTFFNFGLRNHRIVSRQVNAQLHQQESLIHNQALQPLPYRSEFVPDLP